MGMLELLVIFVVTIILVKPEDIPKIAQKIKQVRAYFTKGKADILSYLDIDAVGSGQEKLTLEDQDKINYYLEKIASHGESYNGEYDLEKIKDYFNSIVSNKLKDLK